MKENLFIAFEGIDGSGKSTQAKLLAEKLSQEGHKVYLTFEPTDSAIGSIIRKVFTHAMEADNRTIAGLFVADRLNHLLNKENGILKKLEEGYTVIADRYYFSSYAYQGVHVPLDWVIQANSLSAGLLRPDLNLFIDVPPEVCMQRLKSGRTSLELYETIENLQHVKAKYLEAFEIEKSKEQICTIDGNQTQEMIAELVWSKVSSIK